MRIAVISDIHSNIHALEAVLRDIDERRPDLTICTGDLVGYCANPNEVVELLRRRNIPTVQGNYDDGVGNSRIQCGCDYPDQQAAELGMASFAWTHQHTRDANKDWLSSLPASISLKVGDLEIMFCHGSPRKNNEYLFEDKTQLMLEILLEYQAGVIVCGHTHLPYHRIIDGRHIINSGSVGKPKNGDPRATYGIVDVSNGLVGFEVIRVEYDIEAAARSIEAQPGLPKDFALILRKGK